MNFLAILISFMVLTQYGESVYINKIFDNQLLMIGNALRKMHIKYIQIGDVTVSDDIAATNVRLGDISKIVRKGDASISIDEDTITNQGAVGIDKLDLLMDTLDLNGKTYHKVLVVVYSNMLSFTSDIQSTKTECNQTFSGLKLSRVQGVMLYSRPTLKMNVTSQFLKEVVPFINHKMSSSSFLRIIEKYLNSCSVHSIDDSILQMLDDLTYEPQPIEDFDEYHYDDINEETVDDLPSILMKLIEKQEDLKTVFAVSED